MVKQPRNVRYLRNLFLRLGFTQKRWANEFQSDVCGARQGYQVEVPGCHLKPDRTGAEEASKGERIPGGTTDIHTDNSRAEERNLKT